MFGLMLYRLLLCCWLGFDCPYGDILIYSEPASKVFAQGILSAAINSLTIAIGGSLLLAVYSKTRTQSGSLTKD